MNHIRWGSILLLFLFLLISIVPAFAAIITVDTVVDGIGVPGCSLREAVAAANAVPGANGCAAGSAGSDTIELTASGSYTLTTGSQLSITSTIIIQEAAGVTAIIEAATSANSAAYRVFDISTAGDLTIMGITVRHGGTSATALTGGCINSAGTLSLMSGTVVDSCRTSGNGGAIYASQGTISLISTTISNSRAGGALGGGIYYSGTNISITSSHFISNTAQTTGSNAHGGGLYINATVANVISSTFTGNQALGGTTANHGGAIYHASTGSLTMSDSVLTGNSVSGSNSVGGAISNLNGTVSINGSVLQSNMAGTNGGAYSAGTIDQITNSCIVANGDTAVYDTGGAITSATNNWWGNSWGPRVMGAPAGSGSALSKGDSISGNGIMFVNVSLSSPGPGNTMPIGSWQLTAPTIAGIRCMTCAGPSSNGDPRYCENL